MQNNIHIDFENQKILLPETSLKENLIIRKAFKHCDIVGHSVIWFLGTLHLEQSTWWFGDNPDNILIETKFEKPPYGVLSIINCVFFDCNFINVAVMVNPIKDLERYKFLKNMFLPLNRN